jgi:hypothetical protein
MTQSREEKNDPRVVESEKILCNTVKPGPYPITRSTEVLEVSTIFFDSEVSFSATPRIMLWIAASITRASPFSFAYTIIRLRREQNVS